MYFLIDSHGCAKNVADAEVIACNLLAAGHTLVMNEDEAMRIAQDGAGLAACGDGLAVIINSCGFIESAKKESIDAIMSARKKFPRAKILLAGCLAERYHKELAESLPEADGIMGNGDLSQVAGVLSAMERGERPVVIFEQKGVCSCNREVFFTRKGTAYVKLTEGCNNCCAFCAIPLIRGQLRCSPVKDVLNEINLLLRKGIYEINLIGQDVASYTGLLELLDGIAGIGGGFIVRLLYMHPDKLAAHDLWRGITDIMKKDRRIVPYFDIPFQSGSDSIIRAMGRTGSTGQYQELATGIREALPMAAIRTTFMAGFPGETDEDAAATVRFLRAIRPDWSGCFTYSREEGTAAYSMKGRVSKKKAKERMARITAAQEEVTQKALQARLGQEYDVIIEEIIAGDDDNPTMAIGRAWFQAPEVDGAFVAELPDTSAAITEQPQSAQKAPRAEACIETEPLAIKEGSVVRVLAVSVNGIDIAGRLV